MTVVIVAARDRDDAEADWEWAKALIDERVAEQGHRLVVVSAGCDKGLALKVKQYCLDEDRGAVGRPGEKIRFIEVVTRLWGEIDRADAARTWLSRNATLVELGDEFLLLGSSGGKHQSVIRDLKERAEAAGKPVTFVP